MDNQKLSARVEALEGSDREMDLDIWWWAKANGDSNKQPMLEDYRQSNLRMNDAPNYTASLDAAMSLVPEGRGWIAGWGQVLPDEPMGGAHITAHSVFAGYDVANDVIAEGEAATPALALCAAALKARGL